MLAYWMDQSDCMGLYGSIWDERIALDGLGDARHAKSPVISRRNILVAPSDTTVVPT